MKSLMELIEQKGGKVYTIKKNDTVEAALKEMVDYNIGSLVVVDEKGKMVGIFTERDLLRKVFVKKLDITKHKVKEFMTTNPVVASPETRLNEAMNIMTKKRIRHLPVVEAGKVVGLVSIGDIVAALLKEAEVQIKYLKDYIEDKYPV